MALMHATGKRGISKTYEDTFGEYEDTPTDYICFNYEGDPIEVQEDVLHINTDEVSGSVEPTLSEIITYKLDGSHVNRLTPSLAAFFFTSAADSIATTNPETGVYQHICKFLSSGTSGAWASLKTRNMSEKFGDKIYQYSGVGFPSIEIAQDSKAYAKGTLGVKGLAAYKASSITAAQMQTAMVAEDYLLFSDMGFKRGTYDQSTDVFSSVTDYTAKVRSLNFKFENTIDEAGAYLMGSASKYIKAMPITGRSISLTAKVSFNSVDDATDDWFTDFLAQTEWALNIPMEGALAGATQKFSVIINIPKARAKTIKVSNDNGILTRDLEFTVMGTPNGTTLTATIISNIASYVAGAS